MSGAVDLNECPYPAGKCKCGVCAVCGFHKHMSIHAPIYGGKPGSKPWGHEFHTAEEVAEISSGIIQRAADGDQDEPLSFEIEYKNLESRYKELEKHCENQCIRINKLERSVAQLHKNRRRER